MFAAIYQFTLKPDQEAPYQENWQKIARYFKANCGALGSCLHKGEEGLWVAYSRWPDRATRDAAWPSSEKLLNPDFPSEVKSAIQYMLALKEENKEEYKETCLEVVEDLLI